jgi:transcriptional regulator with XRE-family HTH domain
MSSSNQEILGMKIQDAREKAGLTREELARQACLSRKQLEQIEAGGDSAFYSVTIKNRAAIKIAKLLDVSMDDSDLT